MIMATYFDGATTARRSVTLRLDNDVLAIVEGEAELARWRYVDLRRGDAPNGVLRLSAQTAPPLARLDVQDAESIAAISSRAPFLAHRVEADGGSAGRIVIWSLAAAVSLVLSVIYLVPLFADRLAPFIPVPVEQRVGDAVDNQLKRLFGAETCMAEPGHAALVALGERLAADADLPMPVQVEVLRTGMANAVALPGGRIYVFDGLLQAARSPDELAGVLAHEMGHVAGRDGLRKVLQTGGSAFLLGLLFGDVTGGGAIIFAAQAIADSSYSREAETAADDFAAERILSLGRPVAPLGKFLQRIDGDGGASLPFLSSHPVTAERMRRLESRDRPASRPPLLDDGDWQALKTICGSDDQPTEA